MCVVGVVDSSNRTFTGSRSLDRLNKKNAADTEKSSRLTAFAAGTGVRPTMHFAVPVPIVTQHSKHATK